MSLEGNPSFTTNVRQAPREKALKPLGVPNQFVPSLVWRIDATVFEGRPLLVVYVAKRPSLKTLAPPVRVPAHTAPSRARWMANTLSCAKPFLWVKRSARI